MLKSDTFTADIYVGFTEGYDGAVHTMDELYSVCQKHCNIFQFCVSIIPVKYIYVAGHEDGCVIRLIQYPRFKSPHENIREKAERLAKDLMHVFGQLRVSVIYPDYTITFEREDLV